MAGGLYKAFKTASCVWQIWQLFVPVAIVDEDGKKKTRRRTDHKTKTAFIDTPHRLYRQQEEYCLQLVKVSSQPVCLVAIKPQIVCVFKEICQSNT
jgi:hypothetical protein